MIDPSLYLVPDIEPPKYDRAQFFLVKRFQSKPIGLLAGVEVHLDPTMPDDALDICTSGGKRFRFYTDPQGEILI